MAHANNKLVPFGLRMGVTNDPDRENSYTDEKLSELPWRNEGIEFGSTANTAILNATLRQTSLMTYVLAEYIAGISGTVVVKSPTTEAQLTALVKSLPDAVQKNINSAIDGRRLHTLTPTAFKPENVAKLVTQGTITNAMTTSLEVETSKGYLLDAVAGKVLNDKIATLSTNKADTKDVEKLVTVRGIKAGAVAANYQVFVGTLAEYNALSNKLNVIAYIV